MVKPGANTSKGGYISTVCSLSDIALKEVAFTPLPGRIYTSPLYGISSHKTNDHEKIRV